MLEYRLKFTSLPRDFKKVKIIKKGKEYTLPEAEDLYGKTIETLKEKEVDLSQLGTFNCEISSINQTNILEFTLPAFNFEAPQLQDAIAFDFSKDKMTLSDSEEAKEKLAEINEVEDSLLSEFLQPVESLKEETQSDKKDKIEEAKKVEKASLQQQQEEAEFLASYSGESSDSDVYSEPNSETIRETAQHDESLPNDEEVMNPNLIDDSVVGTRQERFQHKKETELLSKKEFVMLSSPEIEKEIQTLESIIQIPQREGISFILNHMEVKPSDNDFIKQEKQHYLTDNYSVDELEKREITLKQKIDHLLNESNDTLNQFYDQVASKDDSGILKEHQRLLKHDIEEEYQVKSQHEKEQNEHEYQLSVETMTQRHHQEQIDLKNRQEKEKHQLLTTHQSRQKEQLVALERQLEEKYTTEWQQIEFNDKEQSVKNKNDNLAIGKENIQSQVLNKLRQYVLEERTYIQQYIQTWNQRLDHQQEAFELSYQTYLNQQEEQQRQTEENERKAQEERHLRLEEDKIALKKEEFTSSLRDKEHEIHRLKEQLEEERQKGKQESLDYANRQNELIQTINQQKETMKDLMNHQDPQQGQGVAKNTVKKWTLIGSIVAVLGMGAVGFGVSQYYTHQNEQVQAKQTQEQKQKELEETLKENQQQMDALKQEKDKLEKKNQDSQKALEKTQQALDDITSHNQKKDDKK